MENKCKHQILHVEGMWTCNERGEQSQETCMPLSTEFDEHHTIFTIGHVPFLFALLPLTTASFFFFYSAF
jgi:hypothetical protein